jgi:hypothetical protein
MSGAKIDAGSVIVVSCGNVGNGDVGPDVGVDSGGSERVVNAGTIIHTLDSRVTTSTTILDFGGGISLRFIAKEQSFSSVTVIV